METCPRFARFCGKHTRPLLFLMLAVTSVSGQVRPMQADGVVRLLTDLEVALGSNSVDEFARLAASTLPPAEGAAFVSSSFREGQGFAAVRERDRRPEGPGFKVLVEMLLGRGGAGRIATWQLLVRPKADDPDRFEVAGATPVASVDGLVKLELDTTRQYAARDLVFSSQGLTLHLSSGAVFLAQVEGGSTALLFRGRATMRFAPEDPAEQVQVRAFSGRPALETPVESLLIRISPLDFDDHFSAAKLVPVVVNPGDVARARSLFDELSTRSYTLSLGDLTTERWSLLPPQGDVLAELRTKRFGTLTYVLARGDAEDVSLFDRARGRNISVYASPDRLASRGRYYSEDETAAYDVQHYDVDVRFDPEREWISGKGSVRLKTRRDGLATISLKLAEPLAISSISSPVFGRVLGLRVSGQSNVLISLPQALPRDTEVVLEITYSGKLPAQSIDREALDVTADPQQATDPLGSLSQDRPILPEARYLYSNRVYWYPQASVTDFATASLRLTMPAQFQAVASGSLISSTVAPMADPTGRSGDERSERTVRFTADRPVRYLSCLISRFVSVGRIQAPVPALAPSRVAATPGAPPASTPSVTVDVVATPRLLRANRALPERTAQMVEFFASVIGEAPYPDFSLAALDAELPSGHSPAYFAVWNQPTIPTTLSWRGDPVSLNGYPLFFLAHEVAHQWWGQAIGWNNYHEQWLSEGLTQYFAAVYAGHDRGPDTERALFMQMRESAMNLSRHGPVHMGYRLGHVQGDSRIFRGLVYNKSAVVMLMLRGLVGPDAFNRGIQRFYRTHRFQKAGTDDVRNAFEAETSRPLGRFFDQWIHGFLLPEVRLTWRMADSTHLAVKVEQLGETFDFPLTLTVQHADGRIELVPMVVTEPVVEVVVPVPAPVRRVDTRNDTSLVVVK